VNAITYCKLIVTNKEQLLIKNNFSNFEIYKQHLFKQNVCQIFRDLYKFCNVEIIIGPWDEAPAATMQTGFAVLGLYQVMLGTLREPTRRFRTVQSTLVYDGVNVGRLWIWRRAELASSLGLDNSSLTEPTLPISPNAAQSPKSTEALARIVNTTSPPTAAWNDPHLHITIIHGLEIFTVYELFFAVLTFMKVESVKPRTSRVRGFTIIVDKPPITVAGRPIAIGFKELGNPPRTPANPPYLQREWLIKALGGLPAQMLGSGVFKDVISMALKVDDVLLAKGYMVRKQGPSVTAVGGISANATTA